MALNVHDSRTLRHSHHSLFQPKNPEQVSDRVTSGFSGLTDVTVTRVYGFGETWVGSFTSRNIKSATKA